MNGFMGRKGPAIVLGGLLMAMPLAVFAGKGNKPDKAGKPNQKSVAVTAACIEADGSAHVYSCKGLSNVVIWCGSTYIKFDDLGRDGEIYDDVFGCGDANGPISYIAIKSGSQKHSKHNDGYTAPSDLPAGAPSGSGLFVNNIPSCPLAPAAIPVPGDCDAVPVNDDDPPTSNDPPTDEPPPTDDDPPQILY